MRLRFILMSIVLGIFICVVPLTVVHAEEEVSLPKGFVTPQSMFGYREEYKTDVQTVNQLFNYALIDGVYLVFDYVKDNDGYIYGKKAEETQNTQITQTMTSTPSSFAVTLKQKHAGGVTASGTYYRKHTYPEGSMMAGDTREYKNEMTITVSNVTFKQVPGVTHDCYSIYADTKGRFSKTKAYNGTWDEEPKVYDLITRDDGRCYSSYYDYEDDNGNKIFYAAFHTRTKEVNNSYLTIYFRIAGVLPKGAKTGAISNALVTTGEDGGVSIPGAIVIGVLTAGTALIGIAIASGAAGGQSGDATEADKKRKSYKMYVQKDFGDAIRKGSKKPSIIRARMAEIDEFGKEHERNDLTRKITVSADGMVIEKVDYVGKYCEATVRVEENYDKDIAAINFTFTGEGGVFENTINFRVVDSANLEFLLEAQDGNVYRNINLGLYMITGDNFTYDAKFIVNDVVTPPELKDIRAVNANNYEVEFATTEEPYVYKMSVKNKTKAEVEDDIFTGVKEDRFEVEVTAEGEKEPIKGYVVVKLYPEGISVVSKDIEKKNDKQFIHVQAFVKESRGDLDSEYQASQFTLNLAIKAKDHSIINPEGKEFTFEKLVGGGGIGSKVDVEESIAQKYEYKGEGEIWNDEYRYTFMPQAVLCEPTDGSYFVVMLPVEGKFQDYSYKAEIPLRLEGKNMDAMEAWDKEYQKLKERVEQYTTPENRGKWLCKLEEVACKDPKPDVKDLRLASKYVIRQYMDYWTSMGHAARNDAELYDKIVNQLEWVKFVGDCAFSYLVSTYAGPVAEAIITPTKDFLVSAIGETVAAVVRHESIDFDKFEFSKNFFAAGENLILKDLKLTDMKKAAQILGMYCVWAAMKNFYMILREEDKFDIYGALMKTFSDLTSTGLKAIASHLLGAMTEYSPQWRTKLGEYCYAFLKKNLSSATLGKLTSKAIITNEFLQKVIEGLFGKGVEKLMEITGEIHDEFIQSESGFQIKDNRLLINLHFTVFEQEYSLSIDVLKSLEYTANMMNPNAFFYYIYDSLFSSVPCATVTMTPPKDPPLMDNKE